MNENDIIAEYVKERFPEILETFDFAAYRLGVSWKKFGKELEKESEKIPRFLQKVFNVKK